MTLVDERLLESLDLKPGDKVILETNSGVWISVFENGFSLLHQALSFLTLTHGAILRWLLI